MARMVSGDTGIGRIAQEEIGEPFIAKRHQMMPFRMRQGAFTAYLMRFGTTFGVDYRYLAAQRVAVIDATQRYFDFPSQARRLVIESEGSGECPVDIEPRYFGHLDRRTVIGNSEAFGKGNAWADAAHGSKQEENLSHSCSIRRFGREW